MSKTFSVQIQTSPVAPGIVAIPSEVVADAPALDICPVTKLPYLPPKQPKKRPPPSDVAPMAAPDPGWSQVNVAYERHARGDLHCLPRPDEDRAVPIGWSSLPAVIQAAYDHLAEALRWKRVVGSDHHWDDRGRSVEVRLRDLYKRHLRFTKTVQTAEDVDRLHRAILDVINLIAGAPSPAAFDDRPFRVLSTETKRRVHALLSKGSEKKTKSKKSRDQEAFAKIWLDPTIWELEHTEVVEIDANGAITDQAIRQAKWRAEYDRTQHRRRIQYGDFEPRYALGGKTSTQLGADKAWSTHSDGAGDWRWRQMLKSI